MRVLSLKLLLAAGFLTAASSFAKFGTDGVLVFPDLANSNIESFKVDSKDGFLLNLVSARNSYYIPYHSHLLKFDSNGKPILDKKRVERPRSLITDSILTSNGDLIEVGNINLANDHDVLIRKTLADGTPDLHFGKKGRLTVDIDETNGSNDIASKIIELPTKDFLIFGLYRKREERNKFQLFVIKVNQKGVLDSKIGVKFLSESSMGFVIRDAIVLPDKNILIAGQKTTEAGQLLCFLKVSPNGERLKFGNSDWLEISEASTPAGTPTSYTEHFDFNSLFVTSDQKVLASVYRIPSKEAFRSDPNPSVNWAYEILGEKTTRIQGKPKDTQLSNYDATTVFKKNGDWFLFQGDTVASFSSGWDIASSFGDKGYYKISQLKRPLIKFIRIDSQNRLLIAGTSNNELEVPYPFVMRLLPNGELDK